MNCPKCGKSLWFVRSFCPFCEAKIVVPPPLPAAPLPAFAWMILGAWGLWFAALVVSLFTNRSWLETQGHDIQSNAVVWGDRLGVLIEAGIAGWLAWRLYQRPSRRLTVWFSILCVLLLWKSWIGPALLLRGFGKYFAFGPIFWWSFLDRITANKFLLWVLPSQLVLFSLVVWPAYCRRTHGWRAEPLSEKPPREITTGRPEAPPLILPRGGG